MTCRDLYAFRTTCFVRRSRTASSARIYRRQGISKDGPLQTPNQASFKCQHYAQNDATSFLCSVTCCCILGLKVASNK
ncbi:hypothetical protein FKM82_028916 [Ascaphus truei]